MRPLGYFLLFQLYCHTSPPLTASFPAFTYQKAQCYWSTLAAFIGTTSFGRTPLVIPERFEGEDGTQGFKSLPFGGGRRICPGAVLGQRVVGLALGSLIQSFEWERVGPDAIDLAEGTGLTMPKAQPLEALCKPRQAMIHILNKL